MFESGPRLIVITDVSVAAEPDAETRIASLLAAAVPGAVMVQLRDNHLPDRRRLAFGERLAAECRRREQLFVVNDRLDMAVLLRADGVHLGEASVATNEARPLLSASAWVSRACHDPGAVGLGNVDGVLLSPVMAARKGRPALGLAGVRTARQVLASAPSDAPLLYALGGVGAENAAACLSAGADGVAVVGAVLDGRRPPLPLLQALGISTA